MPRSTGWSSTATSPSTARGRCAGSSSARSTTAIAELFVSGALVDGGAVTVDASGGAIIVVSRARSGTRRLTSARSEGAPLRAAPLLHADALFGTGSPDQPDGGAGGEQANGRALSTRRRRRASSRPRRAGIMKHSCVATPNPSTRARWPRMRSAPGRGWSRPRPLSAREESSSASSHPVSVTAKTVPSTPPTAGMSPSRAASDSDRDAAHEQPDPVADRSPEAVPDVGLRHRPGRARRIARSARRTARPLISVSAVNETATSTSAAPTIAVPSVTRITVAQTPATRRRTG